MTNSANLPSQSRANRWFWFVGLYVVSVLAIAGFAYGFKWLIKYWSG